MATRFIIPLTSHLESCGHRLDRAKTEHHRCVWADGVRDEVYCLSEDELAASRQAYRDELGRLTGQDPREIERLLGL